MRRASFPFFYSYGLYSYGALSCVVPSGPYKLPPYVSDLPASQLPKSPAVAPGRGFPSFVVPLGQVNGRDTRVRVAVENCGAKGGRSFFMRQGKYMMTPLEQARLNQSPSPIARHRMNMTASADSADGGEAKTRKSEVESESE